MTKPSWQDFGTYDESAFPEYWDGVIGAWAPFLGPTGSRQHDVSRSNLWQTASALPTYSVIDGNYAIDGAATISATTPSHYLGLTAATMMCWVRKIAQNNAVACAALTGLNTSRFGSLWAGDGNVYFTFEQASTNFATVSVLGAGQKTIGGQYSAAKSIAAAWVNGVRRATATAPASLRTTASTSSLTTDGFSSTGAGGAIYAMVFWNRCLSDGEMQTLGQQGLSVMFERRRRSRRRAIEQAVSGARRRRLLTGMV